MENSKESFLLHYFDSFNYFYKSYQVSVFVCFVLNDVIVTQLVIISECTQMYVNAQKVVKLYKSAAQKDKQLLYVSIFLFTIVICI